MKKITFLALIGVSIFSCKKKPDISEKAKIKIEQFYKAADAKGYEPVSYSEFDTLNSIKSAGGKTLKITGKITHTFKGFSNLGELRLYSEIFDVTAFEDSVFVMPRSFN